MFKETHFLKEPMIEKILIPKRMMRRIKLQGNLIGVGQIKLILNPTT